MNMMTPRKDFINTLFGTLPMFVQTFVSKTAIEAFIDPILVGTTWLNIMPGYLMRL